MSTFKRTIVRGYPRQGTGVTPDNLYWNSFKNPVISQEFGLIDYLDFCPDGSQFLVTSSVNVKVYNAASNKVDKCYSRFTKTAYSGRYRGTDGRLICAGSEDASVRVFDTTSRHVLRHLKGHQAAVHRSCFSRDGRQVVSFSDDRTVALWDVATGTQLSAVTAAHSDYIRAGVVSTGLHQSELVVSGGYDHMVRVWDPRLVGGENGAAAACTAKMNHGAPVESVLFLPGGGLLVSTGGCETRLWDLMSGGRLLTSLSNHTKTVTCVAVCCDGTRLVSGSLDRRLKIYDTATYRLVHTLEYSSPVLSLAVSPINDKIVVGMADGLISIKTRTGETDTIPDSAVNTDQQSRRKSIDELAAGKTQDENLDSRGRDNMTPSTDNRVVSGKRRARDELAPYDQHLRRFEHTSALDSALERSVTRARPQCTVAVIHELLRRGVLGAAVAGRTGAQLQSLCRFIARHVSQPRYTATLLAAADCVVTVYGESAGGGDADLDTALLYLLKPAVDTQLRCVLQMQCLHGALDMVAAGARQCRHQTAADTTTAGSERAAVECANSDHTALPV